MYRALPPWRQRGRCAIARARRQGAAAILAPETASSTKLWSGSQVLIMSYRDPVWITSARNVTAWHQHPRVDTQYTWDWNLMGHLGNQGAGTRQMNKMHSPLGRVYLPCTWSPELLGPGKGTKSNAYPGLWPSGAPENLRRLGKCMKSRAPLGQCPCRAPWSLNSVEPGSTCHLGLWQTQCGPSTVNTPHTCQGYFFCGVPVSLQHKWINEPK